MNNTEDWGHYNPPRMNEVAVVTVNQERDRRGIVMHARDGTLQQIAEAVLCNHYNALQYPLMFCQGEDGLRRS